MIKFLVIMLSLITLALVGCKDGKEIIINNEIVAQEEQFNVYSGEYKDTNEAPSNEEVVIQEELDSAYFWDYKDIEEYGELLLDSDYNEADHKFIVNPEPNVLRNALGSMIKRYSDVNEAVRDFLAFYDYPYAGDSAGGIIKKCNYDMENPIELRRGEPLEMKYVADHEKMINELEQLLFNPNYMEMINESDVDRVKALNEELDRMSKDPVISDIRERCKNYDDLTYEDIAYIGAHYLDDGFERPANPTYDVKRICVMNGNSLSKALYKENTRAKKIKVIIAEKEYEIDLEDTPECQIFDINYSTTTVDKPVTIKVELLETYPGENTTAEDTASISTIRFEIKTNVFSMGR